MSVHPKPQKAPLDHAVDGFVITTKNEMIDTLERWPLSRLLLLSNEDRSAVVHFLIQKAHDFGVTPPTTLVNIAQKPERYDHMALDVEGLADDLIADSAPDSRPTWAVESEVPNVDS